MNTHSHNYLGLLCGIMLVQSEFRWCFLDNIEEAGSNEIEISEIKCSWIVHFQSVFPFFLPFFFSNLFEITWESRGKFIEINISRSNFATSE